MRRWAIWLCLFLLAGGATIALGIWLARNSFVAPPTVVQIGNLTVQAEVVKTNTDRNEGLSGRQNLGPGQGMLFVFEQEDKWAFWMKDMLFSIDIVWINSDRKVVDISKNITPATYPDTFKPKSPAQFILELPAGTATKNNITIGQQVNFNVP